MKICDYLLDYSIVFSFDATGFRRHSKYFSDMSVWDLSNASALVTGGSNGIGKSVVNFLQSKNANVFYTGRKNLQQSDNKYIQVDMADWGELNKIITSLPALNLIVLNAGGMPEKLEINSYGYEYQVSSQLIGHYLLLRLLHDEGKILPEAKIVWVTSGGMYLKKYVPELLGNFQVPYDKVATYANTKRAQVILCQELVTDPIFKDYYINSMHPGWVDTDGVKTAIPQFRATLKNILRTPDQGADTINWMLASDEAKTKGKLFFDRKPRSAYPFFWTKEDKMIRKNLIIQLDQIYSSLVRK
jgi:dehydrogenase/reductase SDR family protein 12